MSMALNMGFLLDDVLITGTSPPLLGDETSELEANGLEIDEPFPEEEENEMVMLIEYPIELINRLDYIIDGLSWLMFSVGFVMALLIVLIMAVFLKRHA